MSIAIHISFKNVLRGDLRGKVPFIDNVPRLII